MFDISFHYYIEVQNVLAFWTLIRLLFVVEQFVHPILSHCLFELGGYDVKFLQRTKASPLELARKRFPRPSSAELSDALSNSLSFLIVREPFERLLSAYRNKLEGHRNKYYKLLGEQIIKEFRKGNKRVSCHTFGAWFLFSFTEIIIIIEHRNHQDQHSKNL